MPETFKASPKSRNVIELTLQSMIIDTHKHKGQRRLLMELLKKEGIQGKVLRAMMQIPRHAFFEPGFEEWAYKNLAFPIACEQTISQPYTVAFQTQLLDLQPRDRVLEIGTGSGYQAAVLYMMGARVYTIERHQELFKKTQTLLENMGYGMIRTFWGDGYEGLPKFAPFDKILLTAQTAKPPKALFDQLKDGGYLVAPVGGRKLQSMRRYVVDEKRQLHFEEFGYFNFVPMLKGKV